MGYVLDNLRKALRYRPFRRKQALGNRLVYVGNQFPDEVEVGIHPKYPDNRIISSKYTVYNFIPKNLFEQFHRVANLYFLIVAVVQLCIDSPVSPYTSIFPLAFVIAVGAIKQGYEDWLRHKADREVNHREAYVVRSGVLQRIRSMEIQVGDVVRVNVNGHIPCDMVLLSSEDPNGLCQIMTANLDGESNLKTFTSVSATRILQTDESFSLLRATVECEQPNSNLYRFVGRFRMHGSTVERPASVYPLGPESVLLAGCSLKNTQFVYGCAIYTGRETKMFLNSKYKSHKYSRVERKMNTFLVIFLVVLLSYAGVWVGIALSYYRVRHLSYVPIHLAIKYWTPHETNSSKTNSVVQLFLGFLVLCNYVIPISMYVSVEVQKFCGSLFFEWDLKMYNPKTDEPARAITSDLNEELGQVEYLFTDKTGTLTENRMEFRMCSVGGAICEEVDGRLWRKNVDYRSLDLPPNVDDLLVALALCHTVRVDHSTDTSASCRSAGSLPPYEYHSSSPDEKALVEACQRFGFVFRGCEDKRLSLSVRGLDRFFSLEHVLDFDPVRKRMSVIVTEDKGSIILYTKGADVSMLERISSGDVQCVENHINEFSKVGLRTLVIARRTLSPDVFAQIDKDLRAAQETMERREEQLFALFDQIETNLDLLGATAVEDKLQDGVPETICALRAAGIKVWVLTGDKEETATNISFSAGHFNHEMQLLHLTKKKNAEDCEATLQQFRELLDRCEDDLDPVYALIIDGTTLTFMIEELHDLLRDVCEQCATVLCCRMTPIQKAQVVKLMKSSKLDPTTAAIGDGANDVSMIQEAHVGIGIMGKEGRQAVQSSDYAISQFRYLQRALLVHGHYFYIRTSTLVQYFFYKNVAMITCQLYYTFFTAYSAQVLYDAFFLTLYNSVFTSLPILAYGLFEQNVRSRYLLENPWCYRTLWKNKRLSNWSFIKWMTFGLWHSCVLFFGAYFSLSHGNSPFQSGHSFGNFDFGAVVMTVCVIVVNIKLMMESYFFNGLYVLSLLIAVGSFFVLSLFYSSVIMPFPGALTLHGSLVKMLSSPFVWLMILLQVVTALLPDIVSRAFRDTFSRLYRVQAQKSKKKKKHLPRVYDPRESFVYCTRISATPTASQTNIVEEGSSSSSAL